MMSRARHLPSCRSMGVAGLLCVLAATSFGGCATAPPPTIAAVPARPEAAAPPHTPRVIETGTASWYGKAHHGRKTASGEIFDMNELTAAHPTLPLGSRVLVTNVFNNRTVEVRINDRGPVIKNRIIDLSYAAARALGAVGDGVFPVRIAIIE
jgi:peptidoglycan lytic transglycosylase